MKRETIIEQLFKHLVAGDRRRARAFVATLQGLKLPAERIANDVFWPLHEMLVKLHKNGQLSRLSYNYATRTLRQIADQGAADYTRVEQICGRVLLFCGPTEGEELGAQLAVDLLESAGYEVFFGGAGIANDEVLAELADRRPTALVLWASAAADAPAIRQLIDQIREIGGHPSMRILCGGGVFNRAIGLADEIGAEGIATTPAELVAALHATPTEATRASGAAAGASRGHTPSPSIRRRTRAVA